MYACMYACMRACMMPARIHIHRNNVWLACLALTTSDYGTVAPATHYGRGVCAALMVLGPVLLGLAGYTLLNALALTPHEREISHNLRLDKARARVKEATARILQVRVC